VLVAPKGAESQDSGRTGRAGMSRWSRALLGEPYSALLLSLDPSRRASRWGNPAGRCGRGFSTSIRGRRGWTAASEAIAPGKVHGLRFLFARFALICIQQVESVSRTGFLATYRLILTVGLTNK